VSDAQSPIPVLSFLCAVPIQNAPVSPPTLRSVPRRHTYLTKPIYFVFSMLRLVAQVSGMRTVRKWHDESLQLGYVSGAVCVCILHGGFTCPLARIMDGPLMWQLTAGLDEWQHQHSYSASSMVSTEAGDHSQVFVLVCNQHLRQLSLLPSAGAMEMSTGQCSLSGKVTDAWPVLRTGHGSQTRRLCGIVVTFELFELYYWLELYELYYI